jgi:hypothetical protein
VYVFVGLMFGDIGIDPWFLLTCAVAAGPPITVRRAALAGGYAHPRRRPLPLGNESYSTVSRAMPRRRPLTSNLRD